MVGLGAALHLQALCRSVALVDRSPPAEETSYGNAGLIQTEAVMPYAFPRSWSKILQVALGRTSEAHIHWSGLAHTAPWIWQYWRHGNMDRVAATARAMQPLVSRALIEHEALMEPAGITERVRRTGYIVVFRDRALFDEALAKQQEVRRLYGVPFEALDGAGVAKLEPHLSGTLAGGIHFTGPASVPDPGDVGKAYAELFLQRGGTLVTADARTLAATAEGWQVQTVTGSVQGRDAVIALGPWSGELLRGLGVKVPLGVKRGYHMHYGVKGNAVLNRPVIDAANGYALVANRRGIRLTTGAEFARLDAPKTPVQLAMAEPVARSLFPLADRLEPEPWMGSRPCLPDLVPMIGPVPGKAGLWASFGHQHLGFTLGPATGRLLAEAMTGEQPFTDVRPYRVDRF
jgi:D-amino-acid dehydrogenase